MLKVLTWLWSQPNGRVIYTAAHVNVWAEIVASRLSIPHRLACVTDTPEGLAPHIEVIPPPGLFEDYSSARWPEPMGYPQCWRRLALFAPHAADLFGAERIVSMDIDVIGGDLPLDPLFDRPEDIVLFHAPSRQARPYNGSMVMLTAGARPTVFTGLTLDGARTASQRFTGSDQAWISFVLGPREATWGPREGVLFYDQRQHGYLSHARPVPPPGMRLMFFPGRPKPWTMAELDCAKEWRRLTAPDAVFPDLRAPPMEAV
jgi:hypothetical protein